MNRIIPRFLRPAVYQGRKKNAPFFENWYCKVVDARRDESMAILFGMSKTDPQNRNVYIRILEGKTGKIHQCRYPEREFRPAQRHYQIVLGSNLFTSSFISLNLLADHSIRGELGFQQLKPWPMTLIRPGAMGPHAWFASRQYQHAVLSMDHEVEGSILLDGREIDFTGGRGYSEKDWGRFFPESWIWMQTNHFREEGCSFTLSAARIPRFRHAFGGLSVGMLFDGNWIRFSTCLGARFLSIDMGENHIALEIRQKDLVLEVLAETSGSSQLKAPNNMIQERLVHQSIQSEIQVRLVERRKMKTVALFEDLGVQAGLEMAGDMEILKSLFVHQKTKKTQDEKSFLSVKDIEFDSENNQDLVHT